MLRGVVEFEVAGSVDFKPAEFVKRKASVQKQTCETEEARQQVRSARLRISC